MGASREGHQYWPPQGEDTSRRDRPSLDCEWARWGRSWCRGRAKKWKPETGRSPKPRDSNKEGGGCRKAEFNHSRMFRNEREAVLPK